MTSRFQLSVAPGTPAGTYPFTLTATSTQHATETGTAHGTLVVSPSGVHVTLSPGSGNPGIIVRGNGHQHRYDDGDLCAFARGPGALVSSLGSTTLTLAPGDVAECADHNERGQLRRARLVATRRARDPHNRLGDPERRQCEPHHPRRPKHKRHASAPAPRRLSQPGSTTFLLLVHNTGNSTDSYSVTIESSSGPVSAALVGTDGSLTQSIPLLILSGLSTAAITLDVNALALGQGTVTVLIQSLTNPGVSATATATVVAGTVVTVPPPTTDGPQVTLSRALRLPHAADHARSDL